MYKLLLLLLACASTIAASAQDAERTIAYLDGSSKPVIDPAKASYRRTVEIRPDHYVVRDYYLTGSLYMLAECSSFYPDLVKEGKATCFYESGSKLSEGVFEEGKPVGLHLDYYENGNLRKEMLHDGSNRHYVQFLSEDGVNLIPDGKGLAYEHQPRMNRTVFVEIDNYASVASYYVTPPADTVFTMVEDEAEYVGGLEKLAMDIRKLLKYPKTAKRKGIEGKVLVQFVVDKSGHISHSQVVKGLDPECDRVAISTVNQLHSWIPAEYRGKEVASTFVLPINFRRH
jgi:TonB family protein